MVFAQMATLQAINRNAECAFTDPKDRHFGKRK
jgi:hypothetical protein